MDLGLSALENLAQVAQHHRRGQEQDENPIPKEQLHAPTNFDSSRMMHPVSNISPHTLMQTNSVPTGNSSFPMTNASLPPRSMAEMPHGSHTSNSSLLNILPNQHPTMNPSYQPRLLQHPLSVNPISQPQPPTQTTIANPNAQNTSVSKEENIACPYCSKNFQTQKSYTEHLYTCFSTHQEDSNPPRPQPPTQPQAPAVAPSPASATPQGTINLSELHFITAKVRLSAILEAQEYVRRASWDRCAVCNSMHSQNGDRLRYCAECGIIQYCSIVHQRQDWEVHKFFCEAFRLFKNFVRSSSRDLPD